MERLWEAVAFCTRLDEADPVAAWREHMAKLEVRAAQLNERKFDALRYRGPGTDFTIGLLQNARWMSALFRTAERPRVRPEHADRGGLHDARPAPSRGHDHLDPAAGALRRRRRRAEGDGRRTAESSTSHATHGAGVVRAEVASDDGAARFGEVALVDGGVARRADGLDVLRHALRRERDLSHRLRLRRSPSASRASPTRA